MIPTEAAKALEGTQLYVPVAFTVFILSIMLGGYKFMRATVKAETAERVQEIRDELRSAQHELAENREELRTIKATLRTMQDGYRLATRQMVLGLSADELSVCKDAIRKALDSLTVE
jgi:hypothetical protein